MNILDWLRPKPIVLPAPPLPSANKILRMIEAIGAEMHAFPAAAPGEAGRYSVSIEHKSEVVTIRTRGRGRTFEEALAEAWGKWPVLGMSK